MTDLLRANQVVRCHSGSECTILEFLGSGSQGEVFKARWGGKDYALKWYYQQHATQDQKKVLEDLINDGPPSDHFLWPLSLAESPDVPGYGYIMPLRMPRYKNLTDLVTGRIDPSFVALITAAIELTKAFRYLHNKGLCYRDISFGNAFFDPGTGSVLVCDNDNVTVNGSARGGVLGTPDFMAPEIVRGEALPSNKTDLFSLAVLLFYLLHISHPLSGKRILSIRCWDLPARELLFGKEPIFIFDSQNTSNAAIADSINDPAGEAGANALRYWPIFPEILKNAFTRSFTVGLNDPDARVTELEWLLVLATLRDSLFRCHCGTPNFFEAKSAGTSALKACWHCGQTPNHPFRIRFRKNVVMLNADTKLYPHHMGDGRDFDFSEPVAEVVQHPTDPSVWGLKNLTRVKWVVTFSNGVLRDAQPGQSLPLANNVTIDFGRVIGEIVY